MCLFFGSASRQDGRASAAQLHVCSMGYFDFLRKRWAIEQHSPEIVAAQRALRRGTLSVAEYDLRTR